MRTSVGLQWHWAAERLEQADGEPAPARPEQVEHGEDASRPAEGLLDAEQDVRRHDHLPRLCKVDHRGDSCAGEPADGWS